jgi:glutathione peroxidase
MKPTRPAVALFALSIASFAVALASPSLRADSVAATTKPAASALDFVVRDIDGKEANLADYKGKVVMIVNVASKCGNTPQYDALEKLYKAKQAEGFVVLGFPANDFKGQEPGTEEEIKAFCTSKYNVTFPLFSKLVVKGEGKSPLYQYLTEAPTAGEFAGEIDWNFAKFLVGRDGKVVARFKAKVKPDAPEVTEAVEKALAAK